MDTTRREFMRQVGVSLAGLLLSSCAPQPTCYVVVTVVAGTPRIDGTRVDGTPESPSTQRWRMLRNCWLDLRDTQLRSSGDTAFSNDLRRRHAQALQTLILNNHDIVCRQAITTSCAH